MLLKTPFVFASDVIQDPLESVDEGFDEASVTKFGSLLRQSLPSLLHIVLLQARLQRPLASWSILHPGEHLWRKVFFGINTIKYGRIFKHLNRHDFCICFDRCQLCSKRFSIEIESSSSNPDIGLGPILSPSPWQVDVWSLRNNYMKQNDNCWISILIIEWIEAALNGAFGEYWVVYKI